MSVRRSLSLLTLLTLVLPVLVFSMQAGELRPRRGEQSRNLQLYTVQRGDVRVAVTAVGSIEADSVVTLSFTGAGRVANVLVEAGDYVLAGDVLVEQVNELQRVAYDEALLRLEQAELQMEDLLEPVSEDDIRVAEARVNSAWGAYLGIQNAVSEDDIRAAELRYQQALQALIDAQHARRIAGNLPNQRDYDMLDAQIGEASFNAEIARLQLDALRNPDQGALNAAYARVVQAQRELEQLQAGPSQFELDRAEIAIQQAQAQLEQAEAALNRTRIVAPFDGVVTAVNVEVGQLVGPGQGVIELADVTPLHVTAQVDEVDIRQVDEGMQASVRLDALRGVEFPATLEQIALVGRNEGGVVSYDVKMSLDQPDPRLRVGMTAEASIIVEERNDVLVIPNFYIRLGRDGAYVNVLDEDGQLHEVEVVLGLRGLDNSEVVSGLKEGDVIAVDLASERFSLFGG